MNESRRTTLQVAGGAGLYAALVSIGMLRPGTASAQAFDRAAFQAKGFADALAALGASGVGESGQITIVSPDIAENGAVVPVGIRSGLPNTQTMALLVEQNPNALAASYEILDGALPEVTMRIKMGQSSDVLALVKADGKFYTARKEIKVTLGGCGG
ncbi:MAG: thiosulfate oxidation carrier protein SoxY [Burkholderiaceae bacterium]